MLIPTCCVSDMSARDDQIMWLHEGEPQDPKISAKAQAMQVLQVCCLKPIAANQTNLATSDLPLLPCAAPMAPCFHVLLRRFTGRGPALTVQEPAMKVSVTLTVKYASCCRTFRPTFTASCAWRRGAQSTSWRFTWVPAPSM